MTAEIVIQSLPDLRVGITLNACDDVDWLGQLEISERQRILFRVCKKCPFGLTRVKQIVVYLIAFLPMDGFPNLSTAVSALHP
jgi:hypothetical protein